jgi:glutathione S-transferase
MELYSDVLYTSPYAFSCFVALREKGLPFDHKTVALHRGEQRSDGYRARSVTGRVPMLEHDGFWLAESSAIIEYLDEAFPEGPRMLPRELRARARARQVMAWVRSDLLALRQERPTHTIFYRRAEAQLTVEGQNAATQLLRVAEQLLPAGATTLFGELGAADVDLSLMLMRLIANGHTVGERLLRYATTHWERPSVREWVQLRRPDYVAY